MNFLPHAIVLLVGLVLGSFLTVLIPRLHEGKEGILLGRSRCPSCDQVLHPLDLIPVLSYVFRLGRCGHCKTRISAWYPSIEVASALTSWVVYISFQDLGVWLYTFPIFFALLFIFFFDLRYQEIHDLIVIPAVLYTLVLQVILGNGVDSLMGATLGFIFFGGQYVISGGRWIGSGDMRIGALMGALLGWKLTLLAILVSYILGSLMALPLLLSGHLSRKSKLPLGPFLVLGTLVAFFYGTEILNFYHSLLFPAV